MTAAQMRAEIERDGPGFIMMATEAIRWFRARLRKPAKRETIPWPGNIFST